MIDWSMLKFRIRIPDIFTDSNWMENSMALEWDFHLGLVFFNIQPSKEKFSFKLRSTQHDWADIRLGRWGIVLLTFRSPRLLQGFVDWSASMVHSWSLSHPAEESSEVRAPLENGTSLGGILFHRTDADRPSTPTRSIKVYTNLVLAQSSNSLLIIVTKV